MATEEVWTELALIGIKGEDDSSEIQFAGIVEDITAFDYGEKDIEGVTLLNGGNVSKKVPMTDESITMKVVPVTTARDGTGIQPFLAGTATTGATPCTVLNSTRRDRHRIVLVWAGTALPTTAEGAVTGEARRITISNAYCTKAAPSFDDKYLSGEIMFKWTPFKKDGTSNRKEEYSATTLGSVSATATDVTA